MKDATAKLIAALREEIKELRMQAVGDAGTRYWLHMLLEAKHIEIQEVRDRHQMMLEAIQEIHPILEELTGDDETPPRPGTPQHILNSAINKVMRANP
jgi:hypothetical protein